VPRNSEAWDEAQAAKSA